ncbi:MAG TPA: chemotaxis protein CheC [Myxococcaceae bacterium]|nr:chemotaxis protein CheC [Myxococcaceae bacterium]
MNALSPAQLDALRELVSIGCGHAAGALSRMMGGRPVLTDLPWAGMSTGAETAERGGGTRTAVVSSAFRTTGELHSSLLIVLFDNDARHLCGALLRTASEPAKDLTEVERSALSEAANIAASACLNAVGTLTGFKLLPTVPALRQSTIGAAVEKALRDAGFAQDPALTLEARFFAPAEPRIAGRIILIPDRGEVEELLRRLGV